MPSYFETDDGDVVLAAADTDEAVMRRGLGKLLGTDKGAVADHHDAIRAAAFEKRVSEEDRVLDAPGGIGGFELARQLSQSALVSREGGEQPGLRAGTD